jgi:hypothetical protein
MDYIIEMIDIMKEDFYRVLSILETTEKKVKKQL